MNMQEAILATTPQDVYDRLVTMGDWVIVAPEDGTLCPLAHYFGDVYPDEGEAGEEYSEGMGVRIGFVRFERDEYQLPEWMDEYQEMMLSNVYVSTMGEAVALLESEFNCE